jgi:hypothetical protein
MDYFNHAASNFGACFSAAGNNFCFPHLLMLKCYNSTALNWYQTLSEWHYHTYLPESQDNCGSGGMLFTATRAQMAPRKDIGNPPFITPFGQVGKGCVCMASETGESVLTL